MREAHAVEAVRPSLPDGHWASLYRRRVLLGDASSVLVASLVAYLVRFDGLIGEDRAREAMLAVIPALWFASLVAFRAYEHRFLGLGSEEFSRVGRAGALSLAGVAVVSYAFKLDIARGFVVIALPAATLGALLVRGAVRHWLYGQRARGALSQSVLVVGHRPGALAMVQQVQRTSSHGLRVVGACLPGGPAGATASAEEAELARLGVPVLGGLDDVGDLAAQHVVDTVAVLPTPELQGPRLRRLGWELERTHAELYVAPALTEIVGPRVVVRPVNGLPLLHVERPELHGPRRWAKTALDKVGSAAGLVVLMPLLVAVAVAVKLDSRGPVFFRQPRVGQGGRVFGMLKFRSMVTDAEARLADLRARADEPDRRGAPSVLGQRDGAAPARGADGQDAGNAVLFKMRDDPRVTRVGRVLRRYSLDELPQLANVLLGQMSLVGPRPPLAREVTAYGDDARRRLLVKPGLTGLWQISGRSDLDWDESVRLDVRYVENWSFAYDLMILWKTLGAVVTSKGAY